LFVSSGIVDVLSFLPVDEKMPVDVTFAATGRAAIIAYSADSIADAKIRGEQAEIRISGRVSK
jgi:hypothetical protein